MPADPTILPELDLRAVHPWDDVERASPFHDLYRLSNAVRRALGVRPDTFVLSARAMAALMATAAYRARVANVPRSILVTDAEIVAQIAGASRLAVVDRGGDHVIALVDATGERGRLAVFA